jgi:folate-binding protein YgfZ
MPLQDYKLLDIEGPDAEKLLQGQCTCDFRRLNSGDWLRGAHCNPKGRILSSFVAQGLTPQHIRLRVHHSIQQTALSALQKYAVFSKVQLSAVESIQVVGLYSLQLEQILTTANLEIPAIGKAAWLENSQLSLLRIDAHRLEMWITKETSLSSQWTEVLATAETATANCWKQLNIRAGITEINIELHEQLLPHELNYQLIDAVSFRKGCYTGQEIISRTHYKATLKKHLYALRLTLASASGNTEGNQGSTPQAITFGSKLLDQNGSKIGVVIQAAKVSPSDAGEQTWELLALIRDSDYGHENVTLEPYSNAKTQWLTLPYAIPKEHQPN